MSAGHRQIGGDKGKPSKHSFLYRGLKNICRLFLSNMYVMTMIGIGLVETWSDRVCEFQMCWIFIQCLIRLEFNIVIQNEWY